MQIIGIIPARYESTRLPGKPLVDIGGKTMIQRVYEQASKALDTVIVATDDKRIQKEVLGFGGVVIMTGPHHQTGTNRCLEAYEIFVELSKKSFDYVINIQGDEPLLDPEQLKSLITCFDDPSTEMATLVKPIEADSNILLGNEVFVVKNKNNKALYFSRSVIPFVRSFEKEEWTKNHTFYKHIGMYGFKVDALKTFAAMSCTALELAESLEQNRWLENGGSISVAVTELECISVDTPADLEQVRAML
jgi:3-deoxy-manno-octulosonate cytidylyltransferase (CMP-KDO synthetase)